MKRIQFFILFFLTLASQTYVWSQDSIAFTGLIGKYEGDKIILRWAPSKAGLWKYGLSNGYKLERKENLQGSTDDNSFKTIAAQIVPWPLEEWKSIVPPSKDDQFTPIAAQMIYGKTGKGMDPSSSILQKSDDLQNKYAYSILAADFSADAATASGLRYEDVDIKPGYTYIYRISSLIPESIYASNPGYTVVYTNIQAVASRPVLSHTASGEKIVNLLWRKKENTPNFSAYYVERSSDGQNFERRHSAPFISADNINDSLYQEYFVFTDSVGQNYRPYQYRVLGITPFGEISQASDTLTGMGVDRTPPSQAFGLKTTQLDNNRIKIEWEYDYESNTDLKGFFIGHSYDVIQDFSAINETIIPANQLSYIDENPDPLKTNFYVIAAVDSAGNNTISLSVYAHLLDSIPPASPTNLHANIDSTGILTLNWNANTEPDIIGYAVHMSNDSTHIFTCVTNQLLVENEYRDTIMLSTLTKHMYFKVVAIDRSHNYSAFSNMLEVRKPDLVPPSTPVFKDYSTTINSILLKWVPSSSEDIAKHELYRRAGTADWVKVFETNSKKVNSYEDTNLPSTTTFTYKIVAIDEDANRRDGAYDLDIKTQIKDISVDGLKINGAVGKTGINLSWNKVPECSKYIVYRAKEHEGFKSMKKVSSTEWIDKEGTKGEIYKYCIRGISATGLMSPFSETITIVYN